jgi:hypothetical protein
LCVPYAAYSYHVAAWNNFLIAVVHYPNRRVLADPLHGATREISGRRIKRQIRLCGHTQEVRLALHLSLELGGFTAPQQLIKLRDPSPGLGDEGGGCILFRIVGFFEPVVMPLPHISICASRRAFSRRYQAISGSGLYRMLAIASLPCRV